MRHNRAECVMVANLLWISLKLATVLQSKYHCEESNMEIGLG